MRIQRKIHQIAALGGHHTIYVVPEQEPTNILISPEGKS